MQCFSTCESRPSGEYPDVKQNVNIVFSLNSKQTQQCIDQMGEISMERVNFFSQFIHFQKCNLWDISTRHGY